jgi:hypothetical protein
MSSMTPSAAVAGQPSIEHVSPKDARALLGANSRNRNLRDSRVAHLAAAIRRGEWELNGETIKVAEDGTLIDGQHRLQAVIAAGTGIDTVVVRGLSIAAQDTVDTGRRRRLADVLAIEGFKDSHALAAAVNVLYRHRNGSRIDYSHSNAPSTQQALELIAEVPEIERSVLRARRVTKKIGGPIGVYAALHCVFQTIDEELTEEFFEGLTDGADLNKGDPVLQLRDQLMRPRHDRNYANSPNHVAGLVIKAFNLKRSGRRVVLLAFRSTEAFPQIDTIALQGVLDGDA